MESSDILRPTKFKQEMALTVHHCYLCYWRRGFCQLKSHNFVQGVLGLRPRKCALQRWKRILNVIFCTEWMHKNVWKFQRNQKLKQNSFYHNHTPNRFDCGYKSWKEKRRKVSIRKQLSTKQITKILTGLKPPPRF